MRIHRKKSVVRQCFKCGAEWERSGQPRSRQVCGSCGAHLHCCMNCHHFDRDISNSCTLPDTTFIGARDAPNYCESFEMVNARLKAIQARTQRARNVWDQLFRS